MSLSGLRFGLLSVCIAAAIVRSTFCGALALAQEPAITKSVPASEQSAFNNARIEKVVLSGALSDRHDELLGELDFLRGQYLNDDLISRAKAVLAKRDIFTKIDVKIQPLVGTEAANTVEVEFLVEYFPLISEIQFTGVGELDEKELRRKSGVRLGMRIDDGTLSDSSEALLRFLAEQGYVSARVEVKVRTRYEYERTIIFAIHRGRPARIESAVIETADLPKDLEFLRNQLTAAGQGEIASVYTLKNLQRRLLAALRKEGYLQGSVKLAMQEIDADNNVTLAFAVVPGEPLSLDFEGNRVFSPTELLAPLRLETRTIPYSAFAVPSLCRDIVSNYRQLGFQNAECRVEPASEPKNGRRRYRVIISEGKQYFVNSIEFEGNNSFSDSDLLALVTLEKSGKWFFKRWRPGYAYKEQCDSDALAITDYYESEGYIGTTVICQMKPTSDPAYFDVQFQVTEHEPARVSNVEIVFSDSAEEPAEQVASEPEQTRGMIEVDSGVPELLGIQSRVTPGTLLSATALESERTRLLNEVFQRGFPNATVETVINDEQKSVSFLVRPGTRVRVGKLTVQGNLATATKVIEREFLLNEGDFWDRAKIEQSEQALYATGLFRTVSVRSLDGDLNSAVEPVAIKVQERDAGSFNVGLGYNSEDGVHVNSELSQRNLWGTGRTAVLGVDIYTKNTDRVFDAGRARAIFREPAIFDGRADLVTELFVQNSVELFNQFSYDRYGGSILIESPLQESLRVSGGLNTYFERLYDVESDVVAGPNDNGDTVFSAIRGQIEYDKRDDPFNPRSGYYALTEGRYNSRFLGSEVDFLGISTQGSVFRPLSSTVVWANNLRLNYLTPFSDTEVIPLGTRLFLGGRNTLRGFSLNAVGPRGVDKHIAGGDFSIVFNDEVQWTVMEDLMLVGFVDIGQSFLLEEGEYTGDTNKVLADLRYSPGVGVRYKTPIGPISIDLGFAMDREFGERFGRFNFGIGGVF